jgi:hypothetical protein
MKAKVNIDWVKHRYNVVILNKNGMHTIMPLQKLKYFFDVHKFFYQAKKTLQVDRISYDSTNKKYFCKRLHLPNKLKGRIEQNEIVEKLMYDLTKRLDGKHIRGHDFRQFHMQSVLGRHKLTFSRRTFSFTYNFVPWQKRVCD